MTIVIPRSITFDAWPAERDRYGLQIDHWNFVYDDDGLHVSAVIRSLSGEQIQFADEVQHTMAKQPADLPAPGDVRPRPKNKLAQILADLHRRAEQNTGVPQRVELTGGLRIDMIVGIDGMSRILLARVGVYPSVNEWTTTLNHLPYDPPLETTPEQFTHNGWWCLRAAWPTPEKVSL
ncbi:MAG: hypothetical protein C4575_13065 [Desulforudis sp.]|nr:MAG: hypothetical protein C4575_13065 [Desulforudis sp.]